MWLDHQKVKDLGAKRKLSLRKLLQQAGVSRTAYYNLTQSATLIPSSVQKIARTLNIPSVDLLSTGSIEEQQYRCRIDQLEKAMRRNPDAGRDNIWHALVLLEQKPIERLRGALRRASR